MTLRAGVPQIHDYLTLTARRLPDKDAVVCGGRRWTFAEIDRCSTAIARHFEQAGVRRGDRIMLFGDNTAETVIGFWATHKANAIAVLVNPLVKREKLSAMIDDCAPAALITEAHLAATWAEVVATHRAFKTVLVAGNVSDALLSKAANARRLDDAVRDHQDGGAPRPANLDIDLAAIIYTSGSTGRPKGVMLTHRNMIAATESISAYLGFREDDVVFNVLSMAFNYGLYQMIMCVRAGARLVLERSFSYPAQVLKRMSDERATAFPGVPTVFSILAELQNIGDFDFSHVRYVTNAGAGLPEKHVGALRRIFPRADIYAMYGQTECNRVCYLPPEWIDRKPTSIGVAIPNMELWIVDEHGERVPPNTAGELVVRSATVMQGYWGSPEATAAKLRPGPVPGERVLYTGDYARFDDDGHLYFVGRMDDIIKSRGEKVPPHEVEAALMAIPGVREAAVIGVPDEVLGQAVKAFLVLEEGTRLGEKDVHRECLARLENFMAPKHIAFVPALPKTDSGKIKKTELA